MGTSLFIMDRKTSSGNPALFSSSIDWPWNLDGFTLQIIHMMLANNIYIYSTQFHCHVHCFETMGGVDVLHFCFRETPMVFAKGPRWCSRPGGSRPDITAERSKNGRFIPWKLVLSKRIWETDHTSLIDWGHMMEFRWNPCLIGCKRNPFFGNKPGNWQTPLI